MGQTAWMISCAALAVATAGLSVLLYQSLRQQGRLLIRLEKAERRTRLPGERPLAESRIERDGLKPGTPAPAFVLPEVRGGTVALEQHRGRKVLLVFSDPDCPPCSDLAPHLVRLHERHRNNGLDLLLVGRGDPEENRRAAERHGFGFPVAIQRRWELSRQFGTFATPAGFLIDENGRIARRAACGVDEILALASSAEVDGEVAHG